jgi:predicted transposase YdaD
MNNLTKKKTYRKSILKYHDVALAVECALERGIKKGFEIGIEIGIKEGIEIGRKRIIETAVRNGRKQNMSIKQIAEYTGLTEEQVSAIPDKQSE